MQCYYTVSLHSVHSVNVTIKGIYVNYIYNITIQCTDTIPLQSSRSHSVIIQSVHSITIKCSHLHCSIIIQCIQCHTLWRTHCHHTVLYTVTVLLYSVTIIMEVLSVEVTINNLNFVICLTYRPPTTQNSMTHCCCPTYACLMTQLIY